MASKFLSKLKRGLFMTHTEFLEKVGEAFQRTGPVEPVHLDRLEEALIAADAGVELSLRLVEELRREVLEKRLTSAEQLRPALHQRLLGLLREAESASASGRFWSGAVFQECDYYSRRSCARRTRILLDKHYECWE